MIFKNCNYYFFLYLGLGDNADEDTTNAGKESEQQKNDLKKIHNNVDDDTKGQLISKANSKLFT